MKEKSSDALLKELKAVAQVILGRSVKAILIMHCRQESFDKPVMRMKNGHIAPLYLTTIKIRLG